MIDTAKKYVGEKFYHIYQFDWVGRMYPVTANFNPQGNDIARGLHIFAKGGAIKILKKIKLAGYIRCKSFWIKQIIL